MELSAEKLDTEICFPEGLFHLQPDSNPFESLKLNPDPDFPWDHQLCQIYYLLLNVVLDGSLGLFLYSSE